MDLRLSDKQQTLQKSFAQFFTEECSPRVVRQMEHAPGLRNDVSRNMDLQMQIWRRFVRLGSTRLTLPTELGGLGWGQSEAVIVAEQTGRALYQSPYLDTLTVADILQAVDATDGKRALLAQIAIMGKSIALAVREHGSDNPTDLSTLRFAVIEQAGGWIATGEKRFVSCAREVQYFLLGTVSPAGFALFLLPSDRPGITIRRHDEIGRGELYAVTFNAVSLAKADLVGSIDNAYVIYELAFARARIRHAAYLIGMCQELLDITLQYTKRRKQFGQPLATFQSIAFRLASFASQINAARFLMYNAAWSTDQKQDIRRVACELLALVSELIIEWTADAVQMHGSYGLSEQSEVQRYYRRAAVDALLLGTPTQLCAEAGSFLAAEVPSHSGI